MAFVCRICKDKFNLTKFLSDSAALSEGFSVVSTHCGHLFHLKCLEAALTNQKLLHARHGTGPLRRFCPVARCNENIPSEDFFIKISFSDDGSSTDDGTEKTEAQETEAKLVKRVQSLMAEKVRLTESLEKSETEAEIFRSAFEQMKYALMDIQSFLKNDYQMKKGDLIFWVTRDGTYAPGKILEIRKKPGENIHYAIVKLDNKTKMSGVGPHAVNRDTLILPVTELITFKSYFSEFFDKFQVAFEALRLDLNSEIQDISSPTGSHSSTDRSASYYRSTRKISRSVSKSSIGTHTLNPLDELDFVSVESVPVPAARKTSLAAITPEKASTKIIRSRTIHCGTVNRPRRLEKCRSMSWATPPSTNALESPTISESSRISSMSISEERSFDLEEDANEFIKVGEQVIWFDTYSEYQQLGVVAAVCEYSPCAIVKFDEHPAVKHKFQYRTVRLNELFPYDLASAEDKFQIAESYGRVGDFVESHKHLFTLSNDESASEGDEINDEGEENSEG